MGFYFLVCLLPSLVYSTSIDLEFSTIIQVHPVYFQIVFVTQGAVLGSKPGRATNFQVNWGDILSTPIEDHFVLPNSSVYYSTVYSNNTDVVYIPKIMNYITETIDPTVPIPLMPFLWLWKISPEVSINFITPNLISGTFVNTFFDDTGIAIDHPQTIDVFDRDLCFPLYKKDYSPLACWLPMKWDATDVKVYIIPGLMHIVVSSTLVGGVLDRGNHICYVLDTKFVDGAFAVCTDDMVYVDNLPRYILLTDHEMNVSLPTSNSIALGTNNKLYPLTVFFYTSLLGPRMLVGKAWVSPLNMDTVRIICMFAMVFCYLMWHCSNNLEFFLLPAPKQPSKLNLGTQSIALLVALLATLVSYALFTFMLWYNIYLTDFMGRAYRASVSENYAENKLIFIFMCTGFHLCLLAAIYCTYLTYITLQLSVTFTPNPIRSKPSIQYLREIQYMTCAMLAWSAIMVQETYLNGDMVASLVVTVPTIYFTFQSFCQFWLCKPATRLEWVLALLTGVAYLCVIPYIITVSLNSLVHYIQDFHSYELFLCILFFFSIVEQSIFNILGS